MIADFPTQLLVTARNHGLEKANALKISRLGSIWGIIMYSIFTFNTSPSH